MRLVPALLVVLAACGRLGFAELGGGTSDDQPIGDAGTGVDAPPSGAAGERYLRAYGAGATEIHVTGAHGEVFAVAGFQGTTSFEGEMLVGQSPFDSEAGVWLDATGNFVSGTVLDSSGYCDIRELAMDASGHAIATGLTIAVDASPALGACAVATNRQDPIAVAVARNGDQQLVAHFVAGGANGQLFHTTPLDDGSFLMSGIYGSQLSIGPQPLDPVTSDTAWYAHYSPMAVDPVPWSQTVGGTNIAFPGPFAVVGTGEACVLGSISTPASVFKTMMTPVGASDIWFARIDKNGVASTVMQLGSSADDEVNKSSVAAQNGGCVVTAAIGGDITLQGVPYPASEGPVVIAGIDATGNIVAARRLPGQAMLAKAGTRLFVAIEVSSAVTLAGQTIDPQGVDVVVVEIADQMLSKVVGVVGGTGDQTLGSFAGIADDALAVGVTSTGDITFAGRTINGGNTGVQAIAVLGL